MGPGHLESSLAIARAAIDATEFGKAREALAPYLDAPTQRVAMLMAEIERTEHGDTGKARAWTLRAVRALHDAVWTADGYVSDRWRPVSPVSGRLDAFQWQMPLSALPSGNGAVEVSPFEQAMLAATPERAVAANELSDTPAALVAQDNAPGTSARSRSNSFAASACPAASSGRSAAAVSRAHRYSPHERKASAGNSAGHSDYPPARRSRCR